MKTPEEIRQRLRGPVCSVPTVFSRQGEVDHNGIRSIIEHSLANGGEVIMLTWGDSLISLLTDGEVADVHRTVIECVGDRAITIACDNMWGLNQALAFAGFVRDLGFDLYMVRPAEWARGTTETLGDYYRAAAREMQVMLVGHVPLGTCELISDEPNILAIKEDAGLDFAHEVLMRWGDRWAMVGGGGIKRHHLLWPHGHCRAWLDHWVRCYPHPSRTYWEAQQRGDTTAAWEMVMRYEVPLRQHMYPLRMGYDGAKRAMLELYGVAPRWRRSPAPNATDEEMAELRVFLQELGVLR
ncbi:MAG: hypothetical protein CL878_08205 [Dehalococcoidia bacterium]|nr:hypothetical protein [Dehalococcoidia bacterium]